MASDETTARRAAFILTVLIGSAIGVAWDVLAALILFRSYTFFESVVVCLLVMILCSVATMRADFEPGGLLDCRVDKGDDPSAANKVSDPQSQLRALVKALFYGIAFAMALVKLFLALVAGP
jgi:hypothetical protein